jgi:predicted RNA-binding Zn ribbon-like protein
MSTGIETVELVGGDLALDLVNTGSRRRQGPFRDRLLAYGDLVTWAERVALVTADRAQRLRAEAERDPLEADRVLERVRALRETVYRVFTAGARGEAPAEDDLASLGETAAEAAARRVLVPETAPAEGYRFAWPESDTLEQLLWPVAMSAAELLVSDDRERVKECATDNCNWLFVDMSRNRSRRWCDMKDCGNRAKARRHYARARGQEEHGH